MLEIISGVILANNKVCTLKRPKKSVHIHGFFKFMGKNTILYNIHDFILSYISWADFIGFLDFNTIN